MQRWKCLCKAVATCVLPMILAVPAAAADDLDDGDITLAIRTELIQETSVPSHSIDVTTNAGIVTLSGSVDTYYAKLQGENAAESVKGAIAVVNDIQVRPLVRRDSRIRGDIISCSRLTRLRNPMRSRSVLTTAAVTLSGEVDSFTEKTVAEDVAEGISGVTDVTNRLTYDTISERTDTDIRADVEYRLKSDASIDAGLVTVSVDDGAVTLKGSVGSASEKSEAESEAWIVAGVQSVANQIDVKWWLDGGVGDWGDSWTDADMKLAAENALLTNPRVKSFNVTTTVNDGVATLTGTVDNLQAKRAAVDEARDVLGIWRVKDFLLVRPLDTRTDGEIARDIRDALQRDPYVDRYDITVTVYNGKAYLGGEVDSWFMHDQAEDAAAGVRGVLEIENNLDIDYEFVAKSDQEIKEDIESELFWSPFVDSDDITVEVHSGVATLKGNVEDWDELQAAQENAREGGRDIGDLGPGY